MIIDIRNAIATTSQFIYRKGLCPYHFLIFMFNIGPVTRPKEMAPDCLYLYKGITKVKTRNQEMSTSSMECRNPVQAKSKPNP